MKCKLCCLLSGRNWVWTAVLPQQMLTPSNWQMFPWAALMFSRWVTDWTNDLLLSDQLNGNHVEKTGSIGLPIEYRSGRFSFHDSSFTFNDFWKDILRIQQQKNPFDLCGNLAISKWKVNLPEFKPSFTLNWYVIFNFVHRIPFCSVGEPGHIKFIYEWEASRPIHSYYQLHNNISPQASGLQQLLIGCSIHFALKNT